MEYTVRNIDSSECFQRWTLWTCLKGPCFQKRHALLKAFAALRRRKWFNQTPWRRQLAAIWECCPEAKIELINLDLETDLASILALSLLEPSVVEGKLETSTTHWCTPTLMHLGNLAHKKIHGKGMAIDAEGEEVPLEIIFQCFEWVWNQQQNKTPVECIGYWYIFGVPHVHGWYKGMNGGWFLVLKFRATWWIQNGAAWGQPGTKNACAKLSQPSARTVIKTSGLGKARWRRWHTVKADDCRLSMISWIW